MRVARTRRGDHGLENAGGDDPRTGCWKVGSIIWSMELTDAFRLLACAAPVDVHGLHGSALENRGGLVVMQSSADLPCSPHHSLVLAGSTASSSHQLRFWYVSRGWCVRQRVAASGSARRGNMVEALTPVNCRGGLWAFLGSRQTEP